MSGAELVKALKESGTGPDKLRVARGVLVNDPKATAEAVVKALEAAEVGEGTLEKCRSLIETGKIETPKEKALDIEDQILETAAASPPAAPKTHESPKATGGK